MQGCSLPLPQVWDMYHMQQTQNYENGTLGCQTASHPWCSCTFLTSNASSYLSLLRTEFLCGISHKYTSRGATGSGRLSQRQPGVLQQWCSCIGWSYQSQAPEHICPKAKGLPWPSVLKTVAAHCPWKPCWCPDFTTGWSAYSGDRSSFLLLRRERSQEKGGKGRKGRKEKK